MTFVRNICAYDVDEIEHRRDGRAVIIGKFDIQGSFHHLASSSPLQAIFSDQIETKLIFTPDS